MDVENNDIVQVIPVHYSNALAPHIHIHQFPLLTRPLQTPPSAALSGKRIRARVKPNVRRTEIHVPSDTRPEVWNAERGKELGAARTEDDRERNQDLTKGKQREGEEPRLGEVRMRSEQVPQKGAHMLGILRDGHLYLHPIAETHQLRPTLTYLDVISKRNKRAARNDASDSDSDDGPPPDPDDPAPRAQPSPKKEKKPAAEAKEVQVSLRRNDNNATGHPIQGGLSSVRREILHAIRTEEEEPWQDLQFCDGETQEAAESFEAIFSHSDEQLECRTDLSTFLKDIRGLS